jgi:ubiquinone/menaquinone biosynthesis C-methylase UbiE
MLNYEMKTAYNTYFYLEKYIKSTDTVLDIGSGTGFVADLIRERTGARVVCLDVSRDPRARHTPMLFDGKSMPFYDEAFTVSICCFVLHHTKFQRELLKEIRRVTKSRIIILEDLTENTTDYFLTLLHKLYSGFRYRSFCTHFRKNSSWKGLFLQCGFFIDEELNIGKNREPTYPVSRRGYILSKNGHLTASEWSVLASALLYKASKQDHQISCI